MLEVELYNRDANGDRVACFATATEIEIAERLRHQLEERYLAPPAPSSTMDDGSGRDHCFDPSHAACDAAQGHGSGEQAEACNSFRFGVG